MLICGRGASKRVSAGRVNASLAGKQGTAHHRALGAALVVVREAIAVAVALAGVVVVVAVVVVVIVVVVQEQQQQHY